METTTTEPTVERELITGEENPDERYPLPSKSDLRAGDGVVRAHDLGAISRCLIDADELSLGELSGLKIAWLFTERGGLVGGYPAFGKMHKESKTERHFSQYDYVASLAVDHLETIKATRWQVEALVCHQLLHIAVSTTEAGEERYGIKGHDFEGFAPEFERYGVYLSGQVSAAGLVAAAVQMGMVFEESEDDDEPYDPSVDQAPGVDEEGGPVEGGAPDADWAEPDGRLVDGARYGAELFGDDEPNDDTHDPETGMPRVGFWTERERRVRENFPAEFADGATVCRACGVTIAAHDPEVCQGGTPQTRKSRRQKSKKIEEESFEGTPEGDTVSEASSLYGDLSASTAKSPNGNGSHDPGIGDAFRAGDITLDPDRVMRTLGELKWKIAYVLPAGEFTGHYVNSETGALYDTGDVESSYRAAVKAR